MKKENPFSFKIEEKIFKWIDRAARQLKTPRSVVIRDLAQLGQAIEKAGGIEIRGCFGLLPRQLAKVEINIGLTETSVRLTSEQEKNLEDTFKAGVQEALPQALRLAYIFLKPDDVKIVGKYLGIPRPLAVVKLPKIEDPVVTGLIAKYKEL